MMFVINYSCYVLISVNIWFLQFSLFCLSTIYAIIYLMLRSFWNLIANKHWNIILQIYWEDIIIVKPIFVIGLELQLVCILDSLLIHLQCRYSTWLQIYYLCLDIITKPCNQVLILQICGCVASFIVVTFIATIIDIFSKTMSWYRSALTLILM